MIIQPAGLTSLEVSGTDTPVLDHSAYWAVFLFFLYLSPRLLYVSLPTRESGHVGWQSLCFRVKTSPGDTL